MGLKSPGPNARNRVALITGGSAGIGAACVRKFLAAGWRVSVVALPNQDLDWLEAAGCVLTAGDITSERTREEAVHNTLLAYDRVDVLINNAGVGLYGLPTEVPQRLFSRLLDVNVIAPLALAQLVIPIMRYQGSGAIVTMGSVAGHVALPWASAYSASKSALHAVHDALRLELRGSPVHMIKVCPGIVNTEFRNNVLGGEAPERVRGIRHVVSADAVATAILDAVNRRRRTVYIPRIGWLFRFTGLFAPTLMDLYLSRMCDSPADHTLRPAEPCIRETTRAGDLED